MSCNCDACETERIGCACDGATDDGCFLCTPKRHVRPPCPAPVREARSDDCPHCKKSMWMGLSNPEGCQCKLPGAVFHTALFYGSPVRVAMPTENPGHMHCYESCQADVKARLTKRVELFHFVQGLQFHLKGAEEWLAKADVQLADRTCRKCGFSECCCPG